jgi:hypothetical protein
MKIVSTRRLVKQEIRQKNGRTKGRFIVRISSRIFPLEYFLWRQKVFDSAWNSGTRRVGTDYMDFYNLEMYWFRVQAGVQARSSAKYNTKVTPGKIAHEYDILAQYNVNIFCYIPISKWDQIGYFSENIRCKKIVHGPGL